MTGARAAARYELFGVVLLQPEQVLAQRLGDPQPLVKYIKAVGAATTAFAVRHDQPSPASGFVVLAVRPNRTSRAWLDLDQPLPGALARELTSALARVPPPAVTQGMVALAIKVGLWGGRPPTRETPMPAEWRAAADAAGRPLEVTQLIDLVWP